VRVALIVVVGTTVAAIRTFAFRDEAINLSIYRPLGWLLTLAF